MAEPESIATVDGRPAVVMNIRKQSGTNTVEVIERLKEQLGQVKTDLPKGWTMQVVRDQSNYIVAAVDAVKEHLILGSLFAALIVWFFLSSPKLREAVIMLAATLATYTLLFGVKDIAARAPLLPVSIWAFVILFALVSWWTSRKQLPFAYRVGGAVVAFAIGPNFGPERIDTG